MMKPAFFFIGLLFSLPACNLYSGLSNPANDAQYLSAARGCLDRGDYDCALSNYQKLSDSYIDVRVNETSLTTLAKNNIFSMSDLIGSLGSNRGSGASFATMANDLATRGAATAANRVLIQETYLDNDSITNTKLKAFSKFISALSMFNAVLGAAIPSGGVLSASNIVSNPSACRSDGSAFCTQCTAPNGTALTYAAGDTTTLNSATGWSGAATIQKLLDAASKANTQAGIFTGSNTSSGIFQSIQQISTLSGAEGCVRQSLLTILNL